MLKHLPGLTDTIPFQELARCRALQADDCDELQLMTDTG